jgi:ATP-dependent phosphofructokinase / diphosphate-dependent phosphofructokinase
MAEYIGVLTSGGDTPGLNAAIRGLGKAAQNKYGIEVIGFKDGFRGLMENRFVRLDKSSLSGILTIGGTILGTSRDKPNKMPVGGKTLDMTDVIAENYHKHHLDALVCLGGGGTIKNAHLLMQKGLNVITLPKTIDNDVAMTDITFGFDTAMSIAAEAIDRLHSTAYSHHRVIVVEIMGHRAGWLALGSGISGGADVILIPEIPYDIEIVAEAILKRVRNGSHFSIVAVAEGAISKKAAKKVKDYKEKIEKAEDKEEKTKLKEELKIYRIAHEGHSLDLAKQLEELTGVESRVTILGHLQRGGTPSAFDRLLATRLGTACAGYIQKGIFGVMVAAIGDSTEPVLLDDVVGKRKIVPLDHSWVKSARAVGTCMGD